MKGFTKLSSYILSLLAVLLVGFYLVKMIRISQSVPGPDYASLIETARKNYTTAAGGRIDMTISIENRGKATWTSTVENPYYLSYHLLDENGGILQFDNRRFPFSHKVKPGEKIETTITVRSPLTGGNYTLEFDLLREDLFWFKDYGSNTQEVLLAVRENKWPEEQIQLSLDYGKYTKYHSSFKDLETIKQLIRLTLNGNEVEFEGQTGKVYGFSAGKNYPQIWLRDGSTIMAASKYYYEAPYLTSWFEEHLAHQKESGSLEDWIDQKGQADKNTTETDQETSAVQAAYKIFSLLGPPWLEKLLNGKPIIDRLENSLSYVFDNRFDSRLGLIKGAHTADWGDVDLIDEGQEAVYVDDRTNWTADTYDQCMCYQACLSLAEMMQSLGREKRSQYWRSKASLIKANANRWLWQPKKGFFRVHVHLNSLEHDFDEEDIFALGGNTEAILSGLADEDQSRKIIINALKRQKTFQVSTISGSLLPPYPQNTFKHHLMDDPYEYQNGAQWDWFGGKLIYAMFNHGFSRQARKKLAEIMAKNVTNRGFFEWDTKDGVGKGSDYFLGSAGSLGKAIFEGYFGLRIEKDSLIVAPKLLRDSGMIHVYLPARDIFIAYTYQVDSKNNKIIMDYNSNFLQKGIIEILCPGSGEDIDWESRKKFLKVLIDGKDTPFQWMQKNNDMLIVFETDFLNHRVEIYF
ncbi:hypothetical protein ACFLT2_08970 [Acidobacteriota bacterium]